MPWLPEIADIMPASTCPGAELTDWVLIEDAWELVEQIDCIDRSYGVGRWMLCLDWAMPGVSS